jgi:hypothetical protein
MDALRPLEGLPAIDDVVVPEDEAPEVVEVDEGDGDLDALRVIEPRPDRRGRAATRAGRSSGRSRSVEKLTG